MELNKFSPLSKIWVYPIKRDLSLEERAILDEKIEEFLSNWKAHGEAVRAGHEIIKDRFIIISADANCTATSGCSIDFMRRSISQTLISQNNEISDHSSVFYQKDSKVNEVSRMEFKELFSLNLINENDLVYDTSPKDLGEYLENGICKTIKNSWHMSLLR